MKEIVYNKSTIPDVNYKITEQIADTDITPQNCDKKHPVFEEHMEQIGKLYLNALNALDKAEDTISTLTDELVSSPKKKKKPCKSEKFSNKGHELINTVANSMQDLTHYYEKLEVENAKLCNQVETLLKVRNELITKLDVLSDKFIKLKSILD